VKPSCKAVHTFIVGLYNGKWDWVFREMSLGLSKRKADAALIAKQGRIGSHLHEEVELVYNKEKVQQENAMKFAASASVAAIASDEVDETRTPEVNDEDDDNESDTKSEVDVENKELKLQAARERHVRSAMNEAVRFVQRPNEKKCSRPYSTRVFSCRVVPVSREPVMTVLGGMVGSTIVAPIKSPRSPKRAKIMSGACRHNRMGPWRKCSSRLCWGLLRKMIS